MENRTTTARGSVNIALLAFAALFIPFLYSLGMYVAGPPEATYEEFLEPTPDPTLGCVRDTDFMRYHHWEFLKDLRDDVLRDGKRGAVQTGPVTPEDARVRPRLQDCRICHESRAEFCDRCHGAVNLTPDCWNCHDYP